MMSDVCVVQAPIAEGECDSNITLGFGVLTAGLKDKGFDVDQVDINYLLRSGLYGIEERSFDAERLMDEELNKQYLLGRESEVEKDLERLVKEAGLDSYRAVFFSLSSSNQYLQVLSVSRKLKEMVPEMIVLIGGSFLNKNGGMKDMYPLRFDFVDFIYRGFIESVDISPGFERGELKGLEGFCYMDSKEPVIKEFNDIDLEDEKKPFYESHIVDQSRKLSSGDSLVMLYRFSRRCNNGCHFCNFKRGYEHKSLSKVTEEIEELKEEYSTSKFLLCDANISFDLGYLERFSERASEIGIEWGGNSHFIRKDEKFYRKLAENGCRFLFHGLESGSDRMLKRMGKPFDASLAQKSIRREYRSGIKSVNHVIVGFPGERRQDFRQTYRFLRNNQHYLYDVLIHSFDLTDGVSILSDYGSYGITPERAPFSSIENLDSEDYLNNFLGQVSIPYSTEGMDSTEIKKMKRRRYKMLYWRFKTLVTARKILGQDKISRLRILGKKPYLRFGNGLEDLFL